MPAPPRPRLFITRPRAAAARLLAELGAGGQNAILSPLMEIVYSNEAGRAPEGIAGLVLTSAHALDAPLVRRLAAGLPAYCVGPRTAQAAAALGFAAEAAQGNADSLVRLILARGAAAPLLHLHGRHQRGAVADRLTAAGIACTGLEVYAQEPRDLSGEAVRALQGSAPLVVPLFSPRSARLLAAHGPFAAPLHVIAMSPAVARASEGLDAAQTTIAAEASQPAMIAVIRAAIPAI